VTVAEFQQSIRNREMAPDPHTLTQCTWMLLANWNTWKWKQYTKNT
jgi:hypothetical protein